MLISSNARAYSLLKLYSLFVCLSLFLLANLVESFFHFWFLCVLIAYRGYDAFFYGVLLFYFFYGILLSYCLFSFADSLFSFSFYFLLSLAFSVFYSFSLLFYNFLYGFLFLLGDCHQSHHLFYFIQNRFWCLPW